MGWFDDNGIETSEAPTLNQMGAALDATAPASAPAVTPGYNRQQFQDGWGASPTHTPEALRQFVADHPEFASGIQFNSADKVTMPGYTEDGTGFQRGSENLDLIQDSGPGGINHMMWGGYGAGSAPAGTPPSSQNAAGTAMTRIGGFGGGGLPIGALGTGSASLPDAPQMQNLAAPTPFSYGQNVPGMERASYTDTIPTPFAGGRQSAPAALNYQQLGTPDNFQYEKYAGPSAADMQADPSYQFRLKQGQDALENSAASKGVLRTGNTAKALIDYGQGAASQEFSNIFNRGLQTNQANNAGRLGAAQTNAQTGLAYNQNANSNALNFGQANIANAQNTEATNYGRSANEAQQWTANSMAANGANNAGHLATTQANNQNALAAQNQGYNQALGSFQANTGNQLAFGQANNQNTLANYQAQTNAALGLGNLNLGFQNSANNYALGQGGLGVQQGQLALQGQGQQFNQGLQTYDRNYQATVTDPWNQNFQLASLGNPGAPNPLGFSNQQGELITGGGNAAAAGTIGGANAWGTAIGNIGNTVSQADYLRRLQGGGGALPGSGG